MTLWEDIEREGEPVHVPLSAWIRYYWMFVYRAYRRTRIALFGMTEWDREQHRKLVLAFDRIALFEPAQHPLRPERRK